MDDFDKKFAKLKIQLEQINWPEVYMFKFIVPADKVNEVKPLFEEGEMSRSSTTVSQAGDCRISGVWEGCVTVLSALTVSSQQQ